MANLNVVTVSQADNCKMIVVQQGRPMLIALAAQPGSTGYDWQFLSEPDPTILSLVSRYNVQFDSAPIGGRIIENWLYNPLDIGTTKIELGYKRSWETNPPVETLTLYVAVVPTA